MRKLSLRVEADLDWPESHSPAVRNWENSTLPSGYTYLFQFVGHDLTCTTAPFSTASRPEIMSENVRREGLKLQTLYGDGPAAARFAYEPSRAGPGEERVKLRLGRIQRDDRSRDSQCPFRDIARGPSDQPGLDALALTEPLIADPRNDAHAILSQVTVLFSLLHNGIVELLEQSEPAPAGAGAARAHGLFAKARRLSAQVFRRVVREDLLRRLLDPRIYAAYESGALLSYAPVAEREWRAPLEFSQGAIRFGHALVRDEYRINDGATNDLLENLTKTSLADPRNMPLNESWVVQWSHFFEIDGSRPNLAKRIGPHYSSGLLSQQIFPAIDGGGRVGLAYRDFMSSAFAGLWSVRALIEEVRRRRPDFVRGARLLDDHAWRSAELSSWLRRYRLFGGLDDDDIASLANDPPMAFYTQWEAMHAAEGLHLGPLGSIIVAETLFAALASPLEDEREAEGEPVGERGVLDRLASVRTMPQLILFVRDASAAAQSIPAFV